MGLCGGMPRRGLPLSHGELRAKKRVAYAKRLLDEIGFGGERLEMYNMSAAMGPRFAEVAREMTEKIRKIRTQPHKKRRKGHGAWGRGERKKDRRKKARARLRRKAPWLKNRKLIFHHGLAICRTKKK